ncbi:cytochrome [Sphingobium yanoikuyae]|uniref:Cytochrome n=1 Tax=Sphingobium yanoikuyae TaxID=13690 RepID=A0A177JUV0_SPHYA|nr:cytochrome P450 [Sphingobium yanoikuyae]OAH44657.1 cytochrome [Sphingobium yanoikuyae]
MAITASFDLCALPPDFYRNPYPYYRALRDHAPAKQLPDGSYFLTRFADLEWIYRNPKLFSSDKKKEFKPKFGDTLVYEHHTTSLVFNDPPLHTQVRRILQGALAPKAIAYMEPQLIALVDRLLDTMAEKGEVDLVEDLASAIPIEVIGNLLGVPHADRGPLRRWSLLILGALEPVLSPAQLAETDAAIADFLAYLEGLVADRRAHPRDPDIDVLSRLILGERNGERLGHRELLQNCIFLLNAGHETTTNFIGNALMTLLVWPDERRRLVTDPALLESFLEEVLRFESPNQLGNRMTVEDVEVCGVQLPAGTSITTCIGAANRDPERFEDPDRFDLARTPNRHLAFASGTHLCLGMNLARLEARTAIGRFLARFPDYALSGEPQSGNRARFRGFMHLPVTLG